MKRSRFRLLLALACLVAIGTAVQDYRFGASISQTQAQLSAVDHEVNALLVSLAHLRAAQMGYLATDQSPHDWMRQASETASQIEAGLGRLRNTVSTPATRNHVEAAATAVADLISADTRARTALEAEQRFTAASVIFEESNGPSDAAARELAAIRASSQESADASLTRQANLRLALIPAALVGVLLIAFVSGRASRAPAAAPPTIADMLRELPPPVKAPGQAPLKLTPPVAVPPASTVNLSDAAELCVDLARVMDARDMQALLERAAKVLEASGLILWVVNQEGTSLLPMLTHGYSERVLQKLSALDVDADNVTSLSFRSARPQTMLGTGPGTTSAIAVPLVTAGGCNGVLAAEVSDAKPSAEFVALSRVIAAQFATMITPCETPATQRAAEA